MRHAIRLSPLTRDESRVLIQQLLKIENFPARMRELILNRAEGNPFFVEELLRSLIDAGAIVIAGGTGPRPRARFMRWKFRRRSRAFLAARIDRLPRRTNKPYNVRPVIGRIFQSRVLAYIYKERASNPTQAALGELQRREFIQSREQQASETAGLEEGEYIFKHAITHDVAYDSMLFTRRKELHQLVAEAIESLFPGRLDELSATLGFSFRAS